MTWRRRRERATPLVSITSRSSPTASAWPAHQTGAPFAAPAFLADLARDTGRPARPPGPCLSRRWHDQRSGGGQRDRRRRWELPGRFGGAVLVSSGPAAAGVVAGLITPPPTKKPKPSKTPPTATTEPTARPAQRRQRRQRQHRLLRPHRRRCRPRTQAATRPMTRQSEPHMIVLDPANAAGCPANGFGFPVAAVGCIWEQVSAPAGDTADQLAFVPVANTRVPGPGSPRAPTSPM